VNLLYLSIFEVPSGSISENEVGLIVFDYSRILRQNMWHTNKMLSVICVYEGTAGSGVLRALYSELTTKVDARIVAANMYQRNALTLKELQSIQSLRDRPVEAAEVLLNVIMEQPDAVYLCFLDVLKHTDGQLHIYQTLVEGGYKGRYH